MTGAVGSVVSLWRYPVKSMLGEELTSADLTERGVLGDRAHALVDRADGQVASAKDTRKWPGLFDLRAAFVEPPRVGASLPPVRIALADGTIVSTDQPEHHALLSRALGREVRLERAEGTFFDAAMIHLLTRATLDKLHELYPAGRFEVPRFRPNLVVDTGDDARGFVEESWVGRTIAVGEEVLLRITGPCSRCVMTTLPQTDLPRDPGILRAAAQHNHGNVGVYASVIRPGQVRRGDLVRLARG
jgi:uncharacterized protein YcbX